MRIFLTTILFMLSLFLFAQENFNPMLYTNTDVVPEKINLEEMRNRYPGAFTYDYFEIGYLTVDGVPLASIDDREGLYRESYGEHSFLRYTVDLSGTNKASEGYYNQYLEFYYETEEGPIFLASCNSCGENSNIYTKSIMSNVMVLPHTETIGFMFYIFDYSLGESEYCSCVFKLTDSININWDRLNDIKAFTSDSHYAYVYFLTNERLEELKKGSDAYKSDQERLNSNFYEIHSSQQGAIHPIDPDISISASRPLFDKKNPFRYTIQNAFDQNPATSYVENTEDDLMEINCAPSESYLSRDKRQVQEIKLINGYASNQRDYTYNNRIASIRSILSPIYSIGRVYKTGGLTYLYKGETTNDFIEGEDDDTDKIHYIDLPLKDNELGYQSIVVENAIIGKYFPIRISTVYPGEKYSDTCIAELNMKFTDKWLFGDNNE
jgi:hypothetical protein